MANGHGVSLESVHQELERLGSIIRGLSTQVASVRVRVSDLERWDAGRGKGGLKLMGKDVKGKGKGKDVKGKGKGKAPGKGGGKGPGGRGR